MAGLFSNNEPAPAPPKPKPVAPMPDRQDPLVAEAERRRVATVLNRGLSRKNTILSQGDNSMDLPYTKPSLGV